MKSASTWMNELAEKQGLPVNEEYPISIEEVDIRAIQEDAARTFLDVSMTDHERANFNYEAFLYEISK